MSFNPIITSYTEVLRVGARPEVACFLVIPASTKLDAASTVLTLGLCTGSVDMFTSLTPTLSVVSSDFVVIDAVSRFASRKCPLGSLVRHPLHGQGQVIEVIGLERVVEFESVTSQMPGEFDPLEYADEEFPPDSILYVSEINIERENVHVSELTELQRKPKDRYTRLQNVRELAGKLTPSR
jgi:hypothetical protein